jgi:hypothetical protein
MIRLIAILCFLFDCGFWLLFTVFLIAAYRKYHTRAALWLGAYAVVVLITALLRGYLFRQFASAETAFSTVNGHLPTSPDVLPGLFAWALMSLSELCALVLLFSELAVLLRAKLPEGGSSIMRAFSSLYPRIPLIGSAAIAFAALSPLPPLLHLL